MPKAEVSSVKIIQKSYKNLSTGAWECWIKAFLTILHNIMELCIVSEGQHIEYPHISCNVPKLIASCNIISIHNLLCVFVANFHIQKFS